MPELVEVERYRGLATAAVDRVVCKVVVLDRRFVRGVDPDAVDPLAAGHKVAAVRRRGKLLLIDLDAAPTIGVHFGMTGLLDMDGRSGVERLLYAPAPRPGTWDRFALRFAGGGSLVVSDPRRLGWVELDPAEDRLGPDALGVTAGQLGAALAGSAVPLKSRLMDQRRLAGIGNLIADEVLWRASLSPRRPAGSLAPAEIRRLHRHLRTCLGQLMARGGSHTGDLMGERHPGGRCPRDGAHLSRITIGGRTSFWCPAHQV